ncbi:MAG: hypothetical protein QM734_04845 [Cyclobacteriaceae bacterium]
MNKNLDLLHNEIRDELFIIGKDNFKYLDALAPGKYDSMTHVETVTFFEALKKFYNNRYSKADKTKDDKINKRTNTAKKEAEFDEERNSYQNEAITELVKNTSELNRIIENGGKLVQKIYPIYKDPDPDHIFDFDAQFYMPAKHFFAPIDTIFFNLIVIWSMTLVLAVLLYYEILLKIIDGIGSVYSKIEKRM